MSKKVPIKKLVRESDAFLTTTDRLYNFYLKNRAKVLYTLLALIVISLIVTIFISVRSSWREKSAAAYYAAVSADPKENLSNMEKVREEWKGYPADRLAAFSMVESYKELGQYKEARDLLKTLAESPKKGEESLMVLIHSYLGALSEETKDYEDALKNYRNAKTLAEKRAISPGGEVISNSQVMDEAAGPFITNLLLSIARVNLSLGNKEAAKEAYAELTQKYPDTMGSYMAELKLSAIDDQASGTPPEPEEALTQSAPAATEETPAEETAASEGDDAPAIEGEALEGEAAEGDAPAAGDDEAAEENGDDKKAEDKGDDKKAGDAKAKGGSAGDKK